MFFHVRRQLAVGQGCFHAGQLGDIVGPPSNGVLHYVYDCGAMSAYDARLDAEIVAYHAYTGSASLDFLFVSHLHADHVAGIERLATPIHVDTIVMPLVNVVDRLIAFARTAAEDPAAADDGFYRALIADPVSAVARFSPRQVVLVTRGEGPAATGGPEAAPESPGPGAGDGSIDAREASGLPWKLAGRGEVRRLATSVADPRRGETGRAGAVYTMPDTRGFEVSAGDDALWMLAPYVDPQVEADRQTFVDALAKSLGSTALAVEDLLRADREGLLLLLAQHKDLLAQAYGKVAALNATSMCLYSGPADDNWPASAWEAEVGLVEPVVGHAWFWADSAPRLGWIGTGDAELGDEKGGLSPRRDAFLAHYAPHKHKVTTLLLPHHGSSKNFHPELLDTLAPQMTVAAAAPYSNWNHPGTAVLQACCARGIPLWNTNHDPRSRHVETLWFVVGPGEDVADFL